MNGDLSLDELRHAISLARVRGDVVAWRRRLAEYRRRVTPELGPLRAPMAPPAVSRPPRQLLQKKDRRSR